jgi:dTDP-4-amino-4,6-dideoxygalactose transaminase
MQELGFNYRITDMQCALGLSQLTRNKAFIERRRSIAKKYDEAFKSSEYITVQPEPAAKINARHLYAVQIDFARTGRDRTSLMNELHKKEIGTQVHYIPVHLQPYYRKQFGSREGNHPVAEEYYRKALSLPLYPKMSDSDVARVINAVRDAFHVK